MEKKDFMAEIAECTIDDLLLIIETQEDLYSDEEMALLKERLRDLEAQEQEEAQKQKEQKKKKQKAGFHSEDTTGESKGGSDYTFQYVISFFVPLVAFILGSILLSKDDENERSHGKTCIIIGLIPVILAIIAGAIVAFIFA